MTSTQSKEQLLETITQAIADNVITPDDLEQFIIAPSMHYVEAKQIATSEAIAPAATPVAPEAIHNVSDASHRLSAVEILFYIAGLILFAAIVSVIVQSWTDGNVFGHVLLSAGVGTLMWVTAFVLHNQRQTPIVEGLKNSLLLTGSLSLLFGGFIIANEVAGINSMFDFFPYALVFAVVGILHLAFDRLVRSGLTLMLGILLLVMSFPVALFSFLQDANAPVDAWAAVMLVSCVLLAAATRVVARIDSERSGIGHSFDSLAAFFALLAMYIASFGENGIFWLFILIVSIIGLFYASIVRQEKSFLGSGSLFLIIAIITISFRYFSSFGVSFCLVMAAAGLLGTAAVATTINKTYFKTSS